MRNSEPTSLTEELRLLEVKIKTLKRDYEQYFLGTRPREPHMVRAEVQKAMIKLANGQIKNTSERFKFNTLNSQFLTYKRHWDDTLRKIENGTYKRHVFKANLKDRERGLTDEPPTATASKGNKKKIAGNSAQAAAGGGGDIFSSYVEAAKSCGQSTSGLTEKKLQAVMEKQASAIKKKMGVKDVQFRVEVVDGKVKLKAKATKAA